MTPTADLMDRNDAFSRAVALLHESGYHEAADELAAALSAMGEARVGGEVLCRECGNATMHMGDLCFFCTKKAKREPWGHKWDRDGERCLHCGQKDWMGGKCSGPRDATPAQPKASECQRCRDWTVTMGVGGGSGKLFVHGTYDAIKACQRQLLHPKASEGEAGGDQVSAVGPVAAVLHEVVRATSKFPTWPTDPLHAIAVLGEEFGELTKAVLQTTYEPHKVKPGEVRTEAIQTAAMAIRFVMSIDAYAYTRCDQHSQATLTAPGADDEKR